MSVGLTVIVDREIILDELVSATHKELAGLLRWPSLPPLLESELMAGEMLPRTSRALLDLESDTNPRGLILTVEGEYRGVIHVGAFYGPNGRLVEDTLFADISAHTRDTFMYKALLAACAIAMAEMVNGVVDCSSNFQARQLEYPPAEFRDRLRCRQTHQDLGAALAEIEENLRSRV